MLLSFVATRKISFVRLVTRRWRVEAAIWRSAASGLTQQGGTASRQQLKWVGRRVSWALCCYKEAK
jgi:hypothetical protein